jgi:urea carboxylase
VPGFKKVLIANRGEIACRVIRTLRAMGVSSVAVYSDADQHALHVRQADEAVRLGPAPVAESYLRADKILEAARVTGAEGIHPGYGFLSENAAFAEACEASGIAFIGPTPAQIRGFGLKHLAREVAVREGVPLLPGTELLADVEEAVAAAARIGYPVMLKSSAGGGGIGLRVCRDEAGLREAFVSVQRLAQQNFNDAGAYLEKYLETARHVEVQIFGDGRGHVLALGDRDCSAQRRNQKVIEETPAPGLRAEVREALFAAAVKMGRAVLYRSAGTVEFVVDARTQEFYFLEVNTRLQVEHGVTEEVTGLDLVRWMVELAAGTLVLPTAAPAARGASIQARVYAEDPAKQFRPSTGRLTAATFPGGVRVDGWVEPGLEISPHYDPLLCKIIVHAAERAAAVAKLEAALAATELAGIETNLGYLGAVLADPAFRRGDVHTKMLAELPYAPATVDVLDGGTQTTIQDWPGRLGYWAVGVPPSGPMDDLALRAANRLVGNPEGTAALEMTLTGPTLRFTRPTWVALAGAAMAAKLEGIAVPGEKAIEVPAGATLRLGAVRGAGARTYLAVRGGFAVPETLGSRSTFMLGGFGGHGGRKLRTGDVLHVGADATGPAPWSPSSLAPHGGASPVLPSYGDEWEIAVLYGPHGAPDFFLPEDMDTFFATAWQVHHNSDRTGVRLIGPRPRWARKDGGEAGLHPSNIHDNAYAVGAVDFTGDMPIILGPDGPSLGGFVCPVTIVRGERWKMGQLKAGDRVRFRLVDEEGAAACEQEMAARLARLGVASPGASSDVPASSRRLSFREVSPILEARPAEGERVSVTYRRAGDEYLLVELGPLRLDLMLRLRVHALMEALEAASIPGLIDLTPGIRSLQIHYDPARIGTAALVQRLHRLEEALPSLDQLEVPSRTVHLPLSWEDPATLEAIEKYMRVVRADAPWCPSNIEFIRRINGLGSVEDVKRIVFDAAYLVLGLGDVYLGAPVATPLDPRHRLVTTKYNPARTWTPENAVGIGGAYMCIYGMEGPGGYQFVGRTLQVWNIHRQTRAFRDGKPWLLRFFDQIRFYPVGADELLDMRARFPYGGVDVRIEEGTFRAGAYRQFLDAHADAIAAFKKTQQAAFEAERERWAAAGQDVVSTTEAAVEEPAAEAALPPGCFAITSPVAGNLWRTLVAPGATVEEGGTVALLEAMKTEIAVNAPAGGVVKELRVAPGQAVRPGQVLAVCAELG